MDPRDLSLCYCTAWNRKCRHFRGRHEPLVWQIFRWKRAWHRRCWQSSGNPDLPLEPERCLHDNIVNCVSSVPEKKSHLEQLKHCKCVVITYQSVSGTTRSENAVLISIHSKNHIFRDFFKQLIEVPKCHLRILRVHPNFGLIALNYLGSWQTTSLAKSLYTIGSRFKSRLGVDFVLNDTLMVRSSHLLSPGKTWK